MRSLNDFDAVGIIRNRLGLFRNYGREERKTEKPVMKDRWLSDRKRSRSDAQRRKMRLIDKFECDRERLSRSGLFRNYRRENWKGKEPVECSDRRLLLDRTRRGHDSQ